MKVDPARSGGDDLSAPATSAKVDLSTLIDAAESAVIERDRRVRLTLRELAGRMQQKAGIGAGAGAAIAASALAWRWWRQHRGVSAAAGPGRRRLGGALSALSMLAALLPADLGRLIPRSPRHFMFAVVPAIGQVLARRRSRSEVVGEGAVPPPATAAAVDLERYCGRWYEIGRLPIPGERHWLGDLSTEFWPSETAGVLAVVAHGRRSDGRMRRRSGVARVVDGESKARLQLSFAPASLRWLPVSWSDYWILHVATDYSCALVGSPDRRRLWLLSRTPLLDAVSIEALIDVARGLGYGTADVVFTPQRRT